MTHLTCVKGAKMTNTVVPVDTRRRNTEAGRRAALATYARRRAIAELTGQGYLILPPGTILPPEIAALVIRP